MVTVYVLRGPSGVGKTTLAKSFPAMDVRISADDYMANEEGKYEFSYEKLDAAHGKAIRRFIDVCQMAVADSWSGNIIVDNTNSTLWETGVYVQIARSYGHRVKVITLICDPKVAFDRGIHKVDAAKVMRQDQQLRESAANMPLKWNQEVRFVD